MTVEQVLRWWDREVLVDKWSEAELRGRLVDWLVELERQCAGVVNFKRRLGAVPGAELSLDKVRARRAGHDVRVALGMMNEDVGMWTEVLRAVRDDMEVRRSAATVDWPNWYVVQYKRCEQELKLVATWLMQHDPGNWWARCAVESLEEYRRRLDLRIAQINE